MFHISTFKLWALIGLLRGELAKACGDDLHCCFQEYKSTMTCNEGDEGESGGQLENLFKFNKCPGI